MRLRTSPARIESPAARREYDDGNPGTVLTDIPPSAAVLRRAGDWVRDGAATYYDDGEAATIPG